jgi:hypothetical protein
MQLRVSVPPWWKTFLSTEIRSLPNEPPFLLDITCQHADVRIPWKIKYAVLVKGIFCSHMRRTITNQDDGMEKSTFCLALGVSDPMTSNMTIEEFRARLRDLVKKGEPSIMGTPFGILMADLSSKPFYGEFNDVEFRLTNNSVLSSSGHIVKGRYRAADSAGTEINYEVRPIRFSYFWRRFVPVFGLIVFNTLLYSIPATVPINVLLAINIFFVVMLVFGLWSEKRQGRKLERRFIEEFEGPQYYRIHP